MNPHSAKALITTLITVAAISLTINLLLLVRLHRTSEQADKWKKAHERLAQRQLFLEKQKESQILSQAEKQKSFSQTTNQSQQTDVARVPKRFSSSAAEIQDYLKEESDENDDFFREEIHDLLAEALEEEFPELNLNEEDLEELTDTVMSIRESLEALRVMERTDENAEVFNELQKRRDQAMLDFERITGMSALKFMLRAPADGGIDRD